MKVRASFVAGEYDVVILSATGSSSLGTWLDDHGYALSEEATPILETYIEQGMYFFVAKVDIGRVRLESSTGTATLSPLRFHFDSTEFTLPVRLGTVNADGPQDLLVHTIGFGRRFDVVNRQTALSPTNVVVRPDVATRLGAFYEDHFEALEKTREHTVFTEYAGGVGELTDADLLSLGVDVVGVSPGPTPVITSTRPGPVEVTVRGALSEEDVARGARASLHGIGACVSSEDRRAGIRPRTFAAAYSIGGNGLVRKPSVVGDDLEPAFKACIEAAVRQVRYPGRARSTKVRATFSFVHERSLRAKRTARTGWVITRMRMKVRPDASTDDLVFGPVDPVIGGLGVPRGASGALDGGAHVSETNDFVTRFVILERSSSKATCKAPLRGRWRFTAKTSATR